MTIIAGFKCREGIVVCADTQETVGTSKRDVPKLRYEAREISTETPLAVAFCGAGDGPFIDRITEQAWEDVQVATSLDEACDEIKRSIENTYEKYKSIFHAGQMPTADLIYGVKANGGSRLFCATGPIVNEREYYSSGAGYYMADFLASRMFNGKAFYLGIRQCVILAAYILFQAKEHVDGCGGESHIAILRDKGASGHVNAKKIEIMTDLLQTADFSLGDILLKVADLESDDKKFANDMELHVKSLESQREYKRQEQELDTQKWKTVATMLGGQEPEETDEFGLPLLKG